MAEQGPLAFGVDVGGSGVKGAAVELSTGKLAIERIKILTPQPSTPSAVAKTVAKIVEQAGWDGPVGVTLPSVVKSGIVHTAANIDKSWIGTDGSALFAEALDGRAVTVLNDADAAGLAEDAHGAARDVSGVVMVLTLGTGIGSAVLNHGVLLPNTEFGHIEVEGKEAEHRAASSIKERHGWTYEKWAKQLSKVLCVYEALLWPDVFVVGGGISRKSDKWIPMLTCDTPVIPAQLRNEAGIVGAAMAAAAAIAP